VDNSRYYFKYPEKIEDRIDENYNNPYYDKIEELLEKARFEVVQLGNKDYLFNITSGKTPRGIHYVEEGGIRFLGATQIVDECVLIGHAPRIKEELHTSVLKGSQLKKGDVLVTIAGTYIGRCAVFKADEECNCNQAVAILRLNDEKVIPEFLVKYLNSNIGQLFFGKLQHISNQSNINTTEIGKIELILPTKPIQKKILRSVAKKESTLIPIEIEIKKLKEKKKDLILDSFRLSKWKNKMGTYFFRTGKSNESLFFAVDFEDLADRVSYLFYDPRQRLLKEFMEKYSTTTLKKAVRKTIVRGIQPEYVEEDGVTVIKTVDIKDEYVDYKFCLKTSEDSFQNSLDAQIENGDVLVASTGYVSIGKVDVYDRDERAIVDGHVSILRLKEGYDPYFMASFLRSHLGKIQFEKWWSGSSGQIEIQPSDLERFIVPDNTVSGIPLSEQRRISEQIEKLSLKIEELRLKYDRVKKEVQNFFDLSLYKKGKTLKTINHLSSLIS